MKNVEISFSIFKIAEVLVDTESCLGVIYYICAFCWNHVKYHIPICPTSPVPLKNLPNIYSPCFIFCWTEIPHNMYRKCLSCYVDPNCSERGRKHLFLWPLDFLIWTLIYLSGISLCSCTVFDWIVLILTKRFKWLLQIQLTLVTNTIGLVV